MTVTDDANRTPLRMGLPWWLLPLALLQLAGCALTCAGGIKYEINSTVVWLWENVRFLAVVGLKGLLVLTAWPRTGCHQDWGRQTRWSFSVQCSWASCTCAWCAF